MLMKVKYTSVDKVWLFHTNGILFRNGNFFCFCMVQ